MLSTSPIKNVNKAGRYYNQQDNYYTRDEGTEKSEWWGKGAEKLELSGKVDEKVFVDLLKGKMPNGEQLGIMVDGEIKHRAGWDLTFSAPKSVSIMAYIGGDNRLIDAHRQAVLTTLSYIEKSNAQARVNTKEGIDYQRTGNITAALYHHDLSREKDPQMHTHAVVMNMTERLDGKWRSLASQKGRYHEGIDNEVNGFIERVRHSNRFFSKMYETELAYHVKQLGYDINTETETGIFEIAGVSREVIEKFSERRKQIKEQLNELGLSGGKAASIAALNTREEKAPVDRDKLKDDWNIKASQLGLDVKNILEKSNQNKNIDINNQSEPIIHPEINKAIELAAKSLSVFKTTFTLEEILMEASHFAIKETLDVNSLLIGVEGEIKNGHLISLHNETGKTLLMSQATLNDENKLMDRLKDNKSLHCVVDTVHLTNFLDQHQEIPASHHEPLIQTFNNDRVVLIEGERAKDALIKPIINIAQSADLDIAILSPSLVGSKKLASAIKTSPETLWERVKAIFIDTTPKHYSVLQFLSNFNDENKNNHKKPDVLIVDQAHLLSTQQKSSLVEWNHQHNTKLILLGNKDTLLPLQRGTSLQQLTAHIKPISLAEYGNKEVVSKRHDTILNEIKKLNDQIIEVNHQDDRYHAMANHYVNLADKDQKSSWIIVQNKKSVEEMNVLTHQLLVENNKIKDVKKFNVLTPVFLGEGKGSFASSYQKNQIVRFNDTYTSLSIARGEYLRVIETNDKSNRVLLQKENGKQIVWNPHKVAGCTSGKVEVFNEKEREIGLGDNIVFQRSIQSKNIVRGERYFVHDIRKEKMQLKNTEGKTTVIDLNKPFHRHIDYRYAATPHMIAHEKPECVIAEFKTKAFQTDQRYFNQTIKQSKNVCVYTDNIKTLVANLEKKSGDRLSAHDFIKTSDEMKKSFHALYNVLENQIKKNSMNLTISRTPADAIDYAMRHLAEREAGFKHEDLINVAMKYAIGNVTQKMLKDAALEVEKAGILIRRNSKDGTIWTTAEAVKIEREILALSMRDKGKLTPIANDELLKKYCGQSTLRPEWIEAIKAITQSTDRVLSIQGRAGTGKTTMMMSLNNILSAKELLNDGGYVLHGIAPTNKAVKELRSRGINAQTIDSFLLDIQRQKDDKVQPDFSKTVLVVDEASMVSNRKMLDLLNIVHDLNFNKMVSTGDTDQNPAIEAGKPHDLIQNQLYDTNILLKDIQRQKNPILIAAVESIYQYNIKKTFAILKKSIIEISGKTINDPSDIELDKEILKIKHYQQRIKTISNDYLSLIKTDENVQIVTPSHRDRKAVNNEVRSQLDKLHILTGEEHKFPILAAKDMTSVERTDVINFKSGQIVRFTVSSGALIKAGDYFTIKNINKEHNLLTLINDNSKEVHWQIPKTAVRINQSIEIFTKDERHLKIGDKIVWVRTNKKENLFSTEFAEVTVIKNGSITVKQEDNSTLTFNAEDKKYQHWDHAYAITAYGAQGGTYSTILALFETSRHKLMNFKNFLVTITRPVNNLRIYTNNIATLQESIEKNIGDKTSSLEIIGQYPVKQKINKSVEKTKVTPSKSNQTNKNSENKITNNKKNGIHFDQFTTERIKEGLNRDAERIAINLLGEPKVRGGSFLKFGNKQGSLSVTIKGEKQGWWNDFCDSCGGRGMLSFIQKYAGFNKQEALIFGAKELGIYLEEKNNNKVINLKKLDKNSTNIQDKKSLQEQKNKIDFARKLAQQSQPIKGTLAEKYLKEHRAIVMNTYPDDVRFHPGIYSKLNDKSYPAMLVLARDSSGQIMAVQATYLDKMTANKVDKSIAMIQKQTFGLIKGATVNFNTEKGFPTLIAEGTETGLSVLSALNNVGVKVTLSKSNFKNIDSKTLSKKVIFCVDNDGQDISKDKLIIDSAKRLVAVNKDVSFMLPIALKSPKQDYNDILKQLGTAPIKHDFSQAVSYKDTPNSYYQHLNKQQVMEQTLMAKYANHFDKSAPLSDKTIDRLSIDLFKDNNKIDRNNLDTYKKLLANYDKNEINKSISKIKDIEPEI